MLLDDGGGEGGGVRKEARRVKIVVSLDDGAEWVEVCFPSSIIHSSSFFGLFLFVLTAIDLFV